MVPEQQVMGGWRRTAAIALAAAGLAVMAGLALRFDAPPSASLSLAGKFWRAGATSRLLNSRLGQGDLELLVALLPKDRGLPLAADVELVLPPGLPAEREEELQRKAAYVLAPRRVVVRREPVGAQPFLIRARPLAP